MSIIFSSAYSAINGTTAHSRANCGNNEFQAKDDYYSSQVQSFLAMHKEQEKNGFVKKPEPRAKELLDFNQTAKYQYKKYSSEFSPSSTHLRHVISDLKMAYTFVGVPESEIDKNIGVAPYGAYKQVKYGDDGDGWDGAIQFFEKKGIGTCEFREHNLKLAGPTNTTKSQEDLFLLYLA